MYNSTDCAMRASTALFEWLVVLNAACSSIPPFPHWDTKKLPRPAKPNTLHFTYHISYTFFNALCTSHAIFACTSQSGLFCFSAALPIQPLFVNITMINMQSSSQGGNLDRQFIMRLK